MVPTLSQVRTWSTEHLIEAATYGTKTADQWEDVFLHMRNQSHTLVWEGAGGEALRTRTGADFAVVSAKADQLRQASKIARDGAGTIGTAQRRVLYAVDDAHNAGFAVREDLSVTDTRTSGSTAEQAARQSQAQAFAADIRQRTTQLLGVERDVAAKITTATAGLANPTFPETPHDHKPHIQAVDHNWKQNPPLPLDPSTPTPPPQPARGLPPEGVRPPVSGNLTVGPPSRPSEQAKGGLSLWDDKGGEWRYDPGTNQWHNPHWDNNPHDAKFSQWQNIQIGELPPHTAEAGPKARPSPPALAREPALEPRPGLPPRVEAPPMPEPPLPKGGEAPMLPGGGPAAPLGPHVVHPPHSIPHHLPILGEDDPWENPRDFD